MHPGMHDAMAVWQRGVMREGQLHGMLAGLAATARRSHVYAGLT